MDRKGVLEAYMDTCALVRETEGDLRRLCRQEAMGGSAGDAIQREKAFLQRRRENAERVRAEAEKVMEGAPARMQRIIRYRAFEGLAWDAVAAKMGRGATAESVRKEYQRFLK